MINNPEKLYIFHEKIDKRGYSLFTAEESKRDGYIDYIRADIARERETKLIQMTYELATWDIFSKTRERHAKNIRMMFSVDHLLIKRIYDEAGLNYE